MISTSSMAVRPIAVCALVMKFLADAGCCILFMGGLCQGRLADCRTFIHMVEKIPRQGRLEGCHRMSAATHLIYGSESV